MTVRHGGARLAIAVGIALALAPAADAGAALFYDLSLGAGAQLNDNLHLDPRVSGEAGGGTVVHRQPVEETIFTLSPGVLVSWVAERDRLRLDYSGEYSIYQGDEDRDPGWAHAVAADLSWRRWSPVFLEARDERSRVPRGKEFEGQAFVDEVDRNNLKVRTGLSFEIVPKYTLELAYHGEADSYSVSGGLEGAQAQTTTGGETGFAAEKFDQVQRHYGEALVRHRWSPLWGGEARLNYGRVDRELASDYTDLRASVLVDQRWSELLTLRYRLEWVREDDVGKAAAAPAGEGRADQATVDALRSHVLAGVSMRGKLEHGGTWTLAYQDALADLPDGDTLKTGRLQAAVSIRARLGSRLDLGGLYESRDYQESTREETAWGPTAGARWMIAPWAAFDVRGSWTSTTIRVEGQPEIEDKTSRVAAGIVLLMFERLQFDLGYGFRKNDSTDELRSYKNNLVFALLTFHLRRVDPAALPDSRAWRIVAGGSPSGGVAQAAREPESAETAR